MTLEEEFFPRYNIAPTQLVPVIMAADRIKAIYWDALEVDPSWAKDPRTHRLMINARAETLVTTPSLGGSIEVLLPNCYELLLIPD